jgi:restriction system protein
MAVPTFEEFMLPSLECMADGQIRKISELVEIVAENMKISEQDRKDMVPSQVEPRYVNRINWAIYYIMRAKLLERPKRGYYKITSIGLDVLKQKPQQINKEFLMKFEDFRKFQSLSRDNQNDANEPEISNQTITRTPQESIQNAFNELYNSLASDLLEVIKKVNPSFFEKLVVDLLLAMGYGGSRAEAGRAVGQSGDGGIDGIIDEDKLGLDKVFIQAKRWDSVVGRPELNKFVGSLAGVHADKGVFITTSDYTKEARDYIGKVGKNISLINGEKLVELMIEHNIGVSESIRYVVKRIDSDYFPEDI